VSNTSGTYRTTRAAVMRAYDKLPPVVRRALANAVFHWAPQPFLTLLRRDGWSPEEVAEEVADSDREKLDREHKLRQLRAAQREAPLTAPLAAALRRARSRPGRRKRK
jgi:Family of unknown function (DUF6525)